MSLTVLTCENKLLCYIKREKNFSRPDDHAITPRSMIVSKEG